MLGELQQSYRSLDYANRLEGIESRKKAFPVVSYKDCNAINGWKNPGDKKMHNNMLVKKIWLPLQHEHKT